jgi:hypothetical protein
MPSAQPKNPPPTKQEKHPASFVEWWKNTKLTGELKLTDEQLGTFTTKLNREELLSQALATKIRTTKRKIQKIYIQDNTTLHEGHDKIQSELLPLIEERECTRMTVRFFVRNLLTTEQLRIIKENYPHFFGVRWFKVSRIPVIKAETSIKKGKKH